MAAAPDNRGMRERVVVGLSGGVDSAVAAWLLVGLWIFAIFWHFTTGEWRQYVPSLDQIGAVILHYGYGIFLGRPHPYKVVPERKHNPLQRLAYLGLKLAINPLIWTSGLAYLFYADWRDLARSEEHTSELQSHHDIVCRLPHHHRPHAARPHQGDDHWLGGHALIRSAPRWKRPARFQSNRKICANRAPTLSGGNGRATR